MPNTQYVHQHEAPKPAERDATFIDACVTAVDSIDASLAVWSLPGEDLLWVSVSMEDSVQTGSVTIADLERGFVYAPFLNEKGEQTRYLKSDLMLDPHNDHWEVASVPTSKD